MVYKLLSELNKGAWSGATAYTVGDIVSLGGSSYVCVANSTNNTPPNATYWTLLSSKGETGETGTTGAAGAKGDQGDPGVQWKGDWSSATAYVLRDVVYRLGSSYICIQAHTNQEPPSISYWELVAQKGVDGEGSGDVIGPASSTSNRVALFDGVTGKLIKDGGETITEIKAASIPATYLDTDETLAANSDTKVASQKAVKTYADTKSGASKTETLTNKTLTAPVINGAITGDALSTGATINTGIATDEIVTPKAIADSYLGGATSNVQTQLNTHTANLAGGWITLGACTYEASDNPTYTFSFASDMTGVLSPGMKIKLTDSTVQYFIVTIVGAFSGGKTIITGYGGTDYDLSGGAITLPYYSHQKAPLGFPLDPTKWTVLVTDVTSRSQASPTQNVWYNPGSMQISVPIGCWNLKYKVFLNGYHAANAGYSQHASLSTANNSESDADFTTEIEVSTVDATFIITGFAVYLEKIVSLASKTIYYLVSKTKQTGINNIDFANDQCKMILRAVSAYL